MHNGNDIGNSDTQKRSWRVLPLSEKKGMYIQDKTQYYSVCTICGFRHPPGIISLTDKGERLQQFSSSPIESPMGGIIFMNCRNPFQCEAENICTDFLCICLRNFTFIFTRGHQQRWRLIVSRKCSKIKFSRRSEVLLIAALTTPKK